MKTKTILTPYFLDALLPGLEELKEWDWILNREKLPESTTIEKLSIIHKALAAAVEEISGGGDLPISIAGDCCTALAVLAGLRRTGKNPVLIWFDAHGDFNTWETSPSGFLRGMPLAILVGKGEQSLLEALDLEPIEEGRVILTDGRDLDPGEKELVDRSSITHLRDPRDLLEYSFSEHSMWIHFDTDILDPEDVPAQNYPAPGGIRKDALQEIFQYLAGTGNICAISLSSWAPDLPGAEISKTVSLELLEVLKKTG